MKKTKKKMDIVYEDKELLVINKPAHLLTIATKNEKEHTLYHEVREYIYKKNQKVFIVHRLDKDTSGIVLFSKNDSLKRVLQDNWNSISTREYIAVVEGKMEQDKGVIKSYLAENKGYEVYVSDQKNGKLAITNYEVLQKNKAYSLVKIFIKTGRKNQIRCQFDSINHPVVGDKKYNSKTNPFNRLGLHATKLNIINPMNKKEYEFISPYPKVFDNLFINKKDSR
jgi:23S rRNA pseudouridine1911/1915/1917 synthase